MNLLLINGQLVTSITSSVEVNILAEPLYDCLIRFSKLNFNQIVTLAHHATMILHPHIVSSSSQRISNGVHLETEAGLR